MRWGCPVLGAKGALTIALFTWATGCAHSWTEERDRPTCLVLSAGGPTGLAHIGALEAVHDEHLSVDCITGTSMGALVGSLFATAPEEPLRQRYVRLLEAYRAESQREAARNAMLGGAVGAVIAGVVTGGSATLPLLVGAAAGAVAAAEATRPLSYPRFARVLAAYEERQVIESLTLPFVTFFQQRQGTGLALVVARSGPVAQAVSRSIANPFIFADFDPVNAGYVDPGADRLLAVPVEETCRAFPRARLLAINASGQASVWSAKMNCPVLEVNVGAPAAPAAALAGNNEAFAQIVARGYEATRSALQADRRR